MIQDIFIVRNNTLGDIELKDFGIIIPTGTDVELGDYDKALQSSELDNYLLNNTLIRIIDNNTVSYTDSKLNETIVGSPASIFIENEGVSIPNTPHNKINFTGNLISAIDAGSGKTDVIVNAPPNSPFIFQYGGTNLPNTPHTFLNVSNTNNILSLIDSGNSGATLSINMPVYGTYFQYVSSMTTSTSTATGAAWTNKLTLTTPTLPTGVYKITTAYGWTHSATSSDIRVRCQLNAVDLGNIHNQETSDTASKHYAHRIFYNTMSGINTITLDFQNEAGSSTMFDATLEIVRVS